MAFSRERLTYPTLRRNSEQAAEIFLATTVSLRITATCTAYDMGPCNDHFLAYMRILPPRSVSMYVCRHDVLKHSFLQTAQPPCIVAQLLVTGWRSGYVLCDVIARKKNKPPN